MQVSRNQGNRFGSGTEETFQLSLDKKYQKKDWSKRPLPKEMIEYAARDVIYLLPLAKILIQKLKKIDRMTWVLEECRRFKQSETCVIQ